MHRRTLSGYLAIPRIARQLVAQCERVNLDDPRRTAVVEFVIRELGADAVGVSLLTTVQFAGSPYDARLKSLKLIDPACGSGAFLIAAFRRLLDERIALEREKERFARGAVRGGVGEAALTADILSNNIHGVDLNPASVEITKLALWLHSARADAPLSSLDHTIRCGNSLVGPEFWTNRDGDVAKRERVNAFDWHAAFPEVWPDGGEGGFDIVLGNPPYVKLQNLHTVDPDVAAWLQGDRGEDTFVVFVFFVVKSSLGAAGRVGRALIFRRPRPCA